MKADFHEMRDGTGLHEESTIPARLTVLSILTAWTGPGNTLINRRIGYDVDPRMRDYTLQLLGVGQ